MDLSFKTGQIINQDEKDSIIKVVIKYTNHDDVKTLRRVDHWYELAVTTCYLFSDQGFEIFNVSSFYDTKHWLNWSAMSTSQDNPVVQVGEKMIKQTETILADILGEQYIKALRHFKLVEGFDNDLLHYFSILTIELNSEDLAGFTEQEERDIAQDIKENPSVKAHFESAKTLTLEKVSR